MAAQKNTQLRSTLMQFYGNPVARVSLELFLTIGAVIFFGIFAIRPTIVTMSNLIEELEQKRKLNQELGNKIAALSTAQTQFTQIQAEAAVLDEAIPSTPLFQKTIAIIEKIASETNLVIESLSTTQVPDEIPAQPAGATQAAGSFERVSMPFTISVRGDYPTIRSFIEKIKDSRRTMIVETVTFSINTDQGENSLTAAITLSIPYFRPAAPAVDPMAGMPPATDEQTDGQAASETGVQ